MASTGSVKRLANTCVTVTRATKPEISTATSVCLSGQAPSGLPPGPIASSAPEPGMGFSWARAGPPPRRSAVRVRDPQAFLGYVRTITRNKFIDRLKARLRHHEKEALPWDEETARAIAAPAALDGRARELWSAVRDLPPEEQRVLNGVYRQGKTYEQVCTETGLPLGTMKRRLRDGLLALRRRFAEGGP